MQHQSTFDAPMLSCGERLTNPRSTRAALLRSKRRRNFPHSPSSFFRFGREDQEECSPGCVTNAFGEMMILDHPANLQLFYRNVVELADQCQADFVQKVEPLPLDL